MKRRMMILLCTSLVSFSAEAGCLEKLQGELRGRELPQQWEIVDRLDGKSIRCVFEEAKKAGKEFPDDFFLPRSRIQENRVQAFLGKNSFPAFHHFEKHFLLSDPVSVEGSEKRVLLGYNSSSLGHFLRQPGYFQVFQNEDGKTWFDYRADVGRLLSSESLRKWKEARWTEVLGNERSLLFRNLLDEMYPVNDDVAVGRALSWNGQERGKKKADFVIVRKP